MKNNHNRISKMPILKKLISAAAVLAMSLSVFAALPATKASAAAEYSIPASGTLLYTMNFRERNGWSPKKSDRAEGLLSLSALQDDPLLCEIRATVNSKSHNWGGEIEGLPLNDYTGYTMFFTMKRNKSTSEKDPNLGVYIDGYYGFYGYSTNLRLLNDMNNLGSHNNVNFSELGSTVEGNTWETEGVSEEHYAIEVNGSKKTIKVFIMNTDAKYVLVDGSNPGEISSFHTDNLGIWFHQFNTDMPIIFGNLTIWQGCILTNEKINTAPVTTAPKETTGSPEDTATPSETEQPPEGTASGTEETTEIGSGSENKGCSGVTAFPSVITALLPAAAALIRKKQRH